MHAIQVGRRPAACSRSTTTLAKPCKIDRLTTDQRNTSVWTWAAWIERSGVRRFVYGCAARSTREVEWQANPEMRELPGLKLGIQQATIGETAFEEVCRRLNDGEIDLRAVFGADTPVTAICATRHLLEAVLGQTAAPVTAYYTMPTLVELLDNDEAALLPLLDALECELGLPFKSSYAARLGNFECFDLHPWLDRSQPFLIEAQRVDLEGVNAVYRIGRTPEFAAIKHMAHVVGRVNGDVVVNRLFDLPVGQEELVFDVPERLDELEFSLFEAAGRIVHSEKSTFMNRVGLVLAPIHRRVQVDDDLSRRAGPSRQGASIVAAHSSMRSLVGAPETGSWRKFAEDMTDVVAQHTLSPSEDRWFPRGIDSPGRKRRGGSWCSGRRAIGNGLVARALISRPPFLSACRVLVGANDGRVGDEVSEVGFVRRRIKDPPPDALGAPAEHAVPVAESVRQIAPGRARPHHPEDALHEHAVVTSRRAFLVRPNDD